MKKSLLLFALVLLLAGCASTGNQAAPAEGTPAVSPSEEPGLTAGFPKMTCRIVDGAEEGSWCWLARGRGDVYTLDTEGLAVDGPLADGAMVEVGFDGMILETYPAKFGHVTGVTVLEEPADDRCGLYLQVLSDLWEVDTALNTGLEELGWISPASPTWPRVRIRPGLGVWERPRPDAHHRHSGGDLGGGLPHPHDRADGGVRGQRGPLPLGKRLPVLPVRLRRGGL